MDAAVNNLREENQRLRLQVEELRLRLGEVDALSTVDSARAGDALFRRTLENMLDACAILAHDWTYLFVNKTYAEQVGRKPEEMIGQTLLALLPGLADTPLWASYRRCMEERTVQRVEANVTLPDGRPCWYEATVQPVPEGIFLRVQDISERKQGEAELRRQGVAIQAAQEAAESDKQRLEAMMEVLPVGVAITDAAGNIILSNAAVERIWRMRRPETDPIDHSVYKAWWPDTGVPVLRSDWASTRAWQKGETVVGQFLEIERGDGSRAFVINSAAPVRDPQGKIVGSVAAVQDVTVLQNELKARARIARLYEVLSRVNETIVRCRGERQLHEHVCRILVEVGGYPLAWIGTVAGNDVLPTASCGSGADYLGEIQVTVDGDLGTGPTGTSIRERRAVVDPDFAAGLAVGPWRERALCHGFRSSAAFPLYRNGLVRASLTLYAREPAAFDAEHTQLLEALAADLSYAHDAIEDERRRALAEESLARSEAMLREAGERKSHFLAMLSHELRNPLAPIKNSLFILDRVPPGSPHANRAKEVIQRQVSQLARLVDDLLDVTRLTRGKLRLERARFDLVEAVRRTAEDHRVLFDAAGLALSVDLARWPLWIDGDAARLAQVVGNLLTNALKFTPTGGKVALAVDNDGLDAVIRVKDTGVGISKAVLARLFEPFMQAEETLERSRGGLGLGLALVKGVIALHGGKVEPRSEGLGSGAEFVIRLPLCAPAGSAQDSAGDSNRQDSEDDGARSSARRVLVVEDNRDAADSLRDILMFGGNQVDVAYDGFEAIAKARQFEPDIVICDIGLPGIDGYEVARALRVDVKLRSAFLVALSGYAQPEDLQRAVQSGFDCHVAKPASMEKIEQILGCAIRSTESGDLIKVPKLPAG
jgi:two-component system CheB/CheR fusion protein